MTEKISKKSAEYVAHATGNRHCYGCSMFRPGSYCKLVRGTINANGHCKYWEAKLRKYISHDDTA